MPEFCLKSEELLLPSHFLTDDDFIPTMTAFAGDEQFSTTPYGGHLQGKVASHGFLRSSFSEFEPFGLSPDHISPVESVLESDEEDYLAELTRRVAHSTLDDRPRNRPPYYDFSSDSTKSWMMSNSPPSTLCGGVMGCGCNIQCSSRGSPGGLSPPVVPPASATPSTWDLLSAAAAEVSNIPFPESGYYTHASVSRQREVNLQILKMKEEYVRKQLSKLAWETSQLKAGAGISRPMDVRSRAGSGFDANTNSLYMALTWPPLQAQSRQQQRKQNGSAMKTVLLAGITAPKKECTGTGVFLPRRGGYPAEPRKKSGCSTVMVPARVAQALNLKLDDKDGVQYQLQSRGDESLCYGGGIALRPGNTTAAAAQKHYNARPQPARAPMKQEIRLPQEWTY